jgi:hypothetical protein
MAEASTLIDCPDCQHKCSRKARSCPQCGKPLTPARASDAEGIYAQVLTHSSLKVGSCLTLLGLIKAVEGVKNVVSIADELLAIGAIAFIVAGGATYIALQNPDPVFKRWAGQLGHLMFLVGMMLLLAICVVIVVEVS